MLMSFERGPGSPGPLSPLAAPLFSCLWLKLSKISTLNKFVHRLTKVTALCGMLPVKTEITAQKELNNNQKKNAL